MRAQRRPQLDPAELQQQARQLAVIAAICGRVSYASGVMVERGQLQAFADEFGVTVTLQPKDLPYMEHPHYDDHPRQVLEWDRQMMMDVSGELAVPQDRESVETRLRACAEAVKQGNLTFIRARYPEGLSVAGNAVTVWMEGPVKGRFFTRQRTIKSAQVRALVSASAPN